MRLGRIVSVPKSLFALVACAVLLAGCGAAEEGARGTSTARSEPPPARAVDTLPAPEPEQLYDVNAMVLEEGGRMAPPAHGPELCMGGVALSSPPQCGGVPIANWDWNAVEGEESAFGTIWGQYHVVGRYDGEVFTVTDVGLYEPEGTEFGSDRELTTPCPEPDGGWVPLDPSRISDRAFNRGARIAERLPGYVALWVDYVGDVTAEELDDRAVTGDPALQIMNVVVTEDAAGAEAAIREAWGGPLCVTERRGHTERELQAIRRDAERFIVEELGLEMTWSQEGDVGVAAEVGVVIDVDGAAQAALDERYGPGLVPLVPALRPIESRASNRLRCFAHGNARGF